MKKVLLTTLLMVLPTSLWAASSGYPLDHIDPDLSDKASLQRGLQTYMNYCMGCHSLGYQRFKRTAEDLEIPENLMLEHIVFDPSNQIGDLMTNTMQKEHAKAFFGAAPPDLTLHSNLKGGPDWMYTYMRTFYVDDSRPLGVNNLVFENVGMPHVLAGLQGDQVRPECMQLPKKASNGGVVRDSMTDEVVTTELCGKEVLDAGYYPLQLVEGSGKLSAEEYDQVVYDLANFMYYVGEPSRMDRTRIGMYVLLFLAFFYVFAWLLGREYHKEFHKA
jgi:cytochrome c1